ncbi:YIP1 family protein [Tabrizicola sp. J26]|uniref:YIP1 family protein n=1 Tax=Alitabrizicola rongguiensis TaxID=2909234 RepID=UPI001F16C694|nr:YIP1 family protein [Tabrizicola rongguiensis]MCF1709915.1 YIP1 family protein [Tabrizicola rongguiensis]
MPVTTDIVESWRNPRAVLRRRLDSAREADALAVLMAACGLIFVSQWPGLARAAHLDPSIPLDARLGGALLGAVFLLPPIAYGIAALSHLVARAFGGKGDWLGARLALFWALLAVSPLMLLQGLVAGFMGKGPALTLVGAGVGLVFVLQWILGLIEAERG